MIFADDINWHLFEHCLSFLCSLNRNVKISANGAVKWDEKIVYLCEKYGRLSDNSARVVGDVC